MITTTGHQFKNGKTIYALAVLLALLFLPGADAIASAGNVKNDGTSYVGNTIVITGQSTVPSSYCGISYGEYEAVMMNPEGGTSMMKEIAISAGVGVRLGTHYKVVAQHPCGKDRLFLDIQEK